MLSLLNQQIDASSLGLLFFLAPVFLFLIKNNKKVYLIHGSVIILTGFLNPLLNTPLRIVSAGIGVAAYLILFGHFLSYYPAAKINWGKSIALATLLSIALRSFGSTVDISISGDTNYIAWILMIFSGWLLYKIDTSQFRDQPAGDKATGITTHRLLPFVLGLFSAFILIYFAFSSPGVISRWTGANYIVINIIFSFSILITIIYLHNNNRLKILNKRLLVIWNLIFTFTLFLSIWLHTIAPPETPTSDLVIVYDPTGVINLVTYLMILFSPVLYFNILIFTKKIVPNNPSSLAIPFTLAGLYFLLLIFILIFSNIWGYIGEFSRIFRSKFYLPFLISGLGMLLPYLFVKSHEIKASVNSTKNDRLKTNIYLALTLFCLTCIGLFTTQSRPQSVSDQNKVLTLMTFNIQQGVDYYGNKNYQKQISLIRRINPDILCLQESDVARISGGNSDIVKYFSDNLDYYHYYGPKTVTGTFGTSILSRYPLHECRSVYSYSDVDEIGTSVAQIYIENKKIAVISNHPDGGRESTLPFINMMNAIVSEFDYVISMGDFNFRQSSSYYTKISDKLVDTWHVRFPDAIGTYRSQDINPNIKHRKKSSGQILSNNRLDMSGRIDYIFVTKNFHIIDSYYLPAPESESDHPAHWAKVRLE
jgi:endonuclease/exonuclease/phosphatase family metal-dependent hydrolase